MITQAEAWSNEICDKCNLPVDPYNNAVLLEYAMQLGKLPEGVGILFTPKGRHLLPTRFCEGSPSRAQYLPGQPRDTRGYRYRESYEAEVRAGMELLRTLLKEERES